MLEMNYDANKARLVTSHGAENLAGKIANRCIKPRAENGYSNAHYEFEPTDNKALFEDLIKILEDNGYKVNRDYINVTNSIDIYWG